MSDPRPPDPGTPPPAVASARRSRSGQSTAAIMLLAAAVLAISHLFDWRMDPPQVLPQGDHGRGLYVEGAFKAHEARRWALFGVWSTNPADNYRFWFAQSPAHVWPLALWLKAFGVTWSNLRLYSVVTYAVGWLALVGAAWRTRRDVVVVALMAGMVGDYYLHHAARSALLEVPLGSWAALCLVAALAALRSPGWLFALPVLGAAAVLTKQSGVFLAPFAVAAALLVARRHRTHPSRRAFAAGWLLACAAVSVALLLYASTDAYWRSVEWNTQHMLDAKGVPDEGAVGSLDVGAIWFRALSRSRWSHAWLPFLPVAMPLVFVQLVGLMTDGYRGRRIDDDDLLALVMLLCVFGLLQLTPRVQLRYSVLLFPFAWWVGGRGAARLWAGAPWVRGAMVVVVVALFAGTHLTWHRRHATTGTTELFDGNAALTSQLSSEDRVVGRAAPWMAFSASAEHYVVRLNFNCTPEIIRALRPTHALRDADLSIEYVDECLRTVRADWPEGDVEVTRVPWSSRGLILEKLALDPVDRPADDPQRDEASAGP